MGVFVLEIKATLEDVESLTVVPGVLWKLDIEKEASEVSVLIGELFSHYTVL